MSREEEGQFNNTGFKGLQVGWLVCLQYNTNDKRETQLMFPLEKHEKFFSSARIQ